MVRGCLLASTLAILPVAAHAQFAPTPPEVDPLIDSMGTELVSGTLRADLPNLWIGGSKDKPILPQFNFVSGMGTRDVNAVTITPGYVNMGKKAIFFAMNLPPISSSYDAFGGTGEKLISSPTSFTFIDRNGAETNFTYRGANYTYYPAQDATAPEAIATTTTMPSGERVSYYYKSFSQPMNGWTLYTKRLQAVTSSFGYMLKYEYVADVTSGNFTQIKKVTAINNTVDYCDPLADHCAGFTKAWPSIQYSGLTNGSSPGQYYETITDAESQTTRLTWNVSGNGELAAIRLPGSAGNDVISNVTPMTGYTATATKNGVTYSYSFGANAGLCIIAPLPSYDMTCPVTITDANGAATTIQVRWFADRGEHRVQSKSDQLGRVTSYSYDSLVRPTRITFPEGNYVNYTYDARGNVTEKREVAKPGSGAADLVTTAQYDASCSNTKTCNKPNSVTDPKGNTTSFTYDPAHGGLLTVTRPAVGGISSVTRYSYVQQYAWVKNSSGGYVQAASPIWLLDQERTCTTTATVGNACAGGASDEVVTSYDYGPPSGPNNLVLRGVVATANGTSRRACYGYDYLARKISETSPKSGLTVCP